MSGMTDREAMKIISMNVARHQDRSPLAEALKHIAARLRGEAQAIPADMIDRAEVLIAKMDANRAAQAPVAGEDMRKVAAIAHSGGLLGMSEGEALIAIRRLSLPYWGLEENPEQVRATLAGPQDPTVEELRRMVGKLAKHIRPTCSELWEEAQTVLVPKRS